MADCLDARQARSLREDQRQSDQIVHSTQGRQVNDFVEGHINLTQRADVGFAASDVSQFMQ